MIAAPQTLSMETDYTEPFEDRIDILYRELELAIKWERPSLLLVIYGSEYVHADADISLENRLSDLGQRAYHIKIRNKGDGDVAALISELANVKNVTFFIEGLRWGDEIGFNIYRNLNKHREFFIDNKVKVVFWLTENEAVDFAHYAPDCWAYRHRVIEFTDQPRTDQLSPRLAESAWQGVRASSETVDDLDAKISFRTALLTDLPDSNESTAARANLLLTLGILHWRRGDLEKASQFIDSTIKLAVNLNDDSFEAMCQNAMAMVETDLGRYDEAIQTYQRAIELAPEKIYPWNNLGNLYVKLGHFEDALPAYQKAIDHNPTDATSWNGLGDVYQKMGRNDDALYAYLKTLELAPDLAQTWNSLAKTYVKDERLDDAFAAHQRALEIDRHIIDSWIGLGEISRRQGREEDALRAYTAATEIDPNQPQVWNELGDLYYNARSDDKAYQAYQKAIEHGLECSQTYNNLASISVHKGNNADTLHFLQKGIELSNNTTERVLLWNRLGDTYRRLGDYENAIASYRKADELNPNAAQHRTVQPATTSESPNTSTAEGALNQPPETPEGTPATKAEEPDKPETEAGEPGMAQSVATDSQVEVSQNPPPAATEDNKPAETSLEAQAPVSKEVPVMQDANPEETTVSAKEDEDTTPVQGEGESAQIAIAETQDQPMVSTEEGKGPATEIITGESQGEQLPVKEELTITDTKETLPIVPAQTESADPLITPPQQEFPQPSDNTPDITQVESVLEDESSGPEAELAETQPLAVVRKETEQPDADLQENENPSADESKGERVEVDFAEWLSSLGDLSADPAQPAEDAIEPAQVPQVEAEISPENSPAEPPVADIETEGACWVYKNKNTDTPDELDETKTDPKLVILGSRILSDETSDKPVIAAKEKENASLDESGTEQVQPQKVVLENPTQNQSEIDSKNAQIWNELGNIYFNAGKVDDAVHAFNKAMDLDPNYGWTYYNLASLFVHRGQYNEALPLYLKGINLLKDPKEKALIWNHLGDAYRRLGDQESAKAAYDKAEELESEKTPLLTRARLSLLGNCRA